MRGNPTSRGVRALAVGAATALVATACSGGAPSTSCDTFDASEVRIEAQGQAALRADTGNTGRFDAPAIRERPTLETHSRANGFLVHAGTAYRASGWALCAIDITSGKRVWTETRKGGFGPPSLDDGVLVAPNASPRDTHVYAFDAGTGEELWRWTQPRDPDAKSGSIGYALIGGGYVVVQGSEGAFGLDARSGAELWRADLPASGLPAIQGKTVFLASGRELRALDLSTGEALWNWSAESPLSPWPVVGQELVYVVGGVTYALDRMTGETRWEADVADDLPPALGGRSLFVPDGSSMVALDASTGEVRWRRDTEEQDFLTMPASVSDGVVYAGTQRGLVYAWTGGSGEQLWSLKVEIERCLAEDAPPQPGPECRLFTPQLRSLLLIPDGGRLYVGGIRAVVPSYDGGLYVLR